MPTKTGKKKNSSTRVIENASEFGAAGKGVRLFCNAFHKQLKDIKDMTLSGRLISKFTQIIQSDPVHARGQRTIAAGDISLLEGLDFCNKKPLLRILHVQPVITIDRALGQCLVQFPPFNPDHDVSVKKSVTHLSITAVISEVDFDKERFVTYTHTTDPLSLTGNCAGFAIPLTFPAGSRLPIIVAVGVTLLQVVNGQAYEMVEGGKLALQVVKAENGSLKPEAGSLRAEVGSLKSEAGHVKAATRSKKPKRTEKVPAKDLLPQGLSSIIRVKGKVKQPGKKLKG